MTVVQSEWGKEYLQDRILGEFALARHLGLTIESADADNVVISAPFAPNANCMGCAFGGSLFSVAVLTGWAWVARHLAASRLTGEAVIQESTVRYFVPVRGTLRARLAAPPRRDVERFDKMLTRAGRGRIELHVEIHEDMLLATRFDGVYAAAIRRP